MFPRFPFFYRGNWGNPQIRQGHIFSKTVARTNIETECFFQFFGFFVAFISQIFIQMNLQKYLKTKYIWWKKWQKYFSFRRGKIFLPYLTRRGKIFLPRLKEKYFCYGKNIFPRLTEKYFCHGKNIFPSDVP